MGVEEARAVADAATATRAAGTARLRWVESVHPPPSGDAARLLGPVTQAVSGVSDLARRRTRVTIRRQPCDTCDGLRIEVEVATPVLEPRPSVAPASMAEVAAGLWRRRRDYRRAQRRRLTGR